MKQKSCLMIIALALVLVSVQADYSLTSSCSTNCLINNIPCKNCIYLSGGPFGTNSPLCADQQPELVAYCNASVTFTCASNCTAGCAFQANSPAFGTGSGCTNNNYQSWDCADCTIPGVLQLLNFLFYVYSEFTNVNYYNWDSGCAPLSGGGIAGIVAGVIFFITLVLAGISCYRRNTMVSVGGLSGYSKKVQLMDVAGDKSPKD